MHRLCSPAWQNSQRPHDRSGIEHHAIAGLNGTDFFTGGVYHSRAVGAQDMRHFKRQPGKTFDHEQIQVIEGGSLHPHSHLTTSHRGIGN